MSLLLDACRFSKQKNGAIMQLNELVKKAAEQGIGSIEGAQRPLVPFTMLPRPDLTDAFQVTVTRFASEFPEQSLRTAQSSLRPNSGVPMYALAWRGSVTMEGREWDAVLIESGESETEEGAIYAQRYELQKAGLFKNKRVTVPIGEPVITGRCTSRLWSPR
jgi:hypothetical protein